MSEIYKEFELLKLKYSLVELAQLCSLLTEYVDKNAMAKSTVDIIGDAINRTVNIDLSPSQLIDTINNTGSISRTRGAK